MSTAATRFIEEPARSIPVSAEYDVLVVGGGPRASRLRWQRPRTACASG